MERILESALKSAEAAEVFYEESELRAVSFENNKLKYVTTKALRGVGLRVIKNGRIGFSSTTDLDKPDKLVENALTSAKFGQEAAFEFPSRADGFPDVKVHDPRVVSYPMEEAVVSGRAAIEKVLSAKPDVKCHVEIDKSCGRVRLMNSAGLDLECESTSFGMGIESLWARDEGLVWIQEGESSLALRGDILDHAAKIVEKLRPAEKEVGLGVEALPVVFTPKAAQAVFASFLAGVNGKLVQKGASPLCGKIGEQLMDERISIYDDATIDYAPGAGPADDEGVPARRTVLFEKGVLKNYIYDLQTAGLAGARSTANGMRSFDSQPSPGNTNVIVSTGDMKIDDMIADMKRGILVDQVLGAGQSNVLAGEFSLNVELGFLVENGRITARIKDCMVAGNVFEAFRDIAGVGAEAEWHGAMRLPAVYFARLSVAGNRSE